MEVAGPSTPLTAPAPSTAVAQTPDDEGEFGDTVGSLPSEFRSPAPLAKTMNSRLSLCRGEAVDEVRPVVAFAVLAVWYLRLLWLRFPP